MLTLDISKLTAADVDLIEDTLNEKLANHPAFAGRIITFQDVVDDLRPRDENEDRPRRIPFAKLTRTLELVELRRVNPAATWDDTGRTPLAEMFGAETDEPDPAWNPPSSEPSS